MDSKACKSLAPKAVALGGEPRPLDVGGATESANQPSGGDHAVVGQARFGGAAHEIAHRARGPRLPGKPGEVAVGAHLARRNAREQSQYAPAKDRGGAQRTTASDNTRPSARGSTMPVSRASVGAISAGDAVVRY